MMTTRPVAPMTPLRQRLIDDMNMRRFSRATQRKLCPRRQPLCQLPGTPAGYGDGG